MAGKLIKSMTQPQVGKAYPLTEAQATTIAKALAYAGHRDVWFGGNVGDVLYIASTPQGAPTDGSIRQYTYIPVDNLPLD